MKIKRFWLLVTVVLLASHAGAKQQASLSPAPSVLVSIHPVALLIKSAWPQLHVTTLMKPNQSPHDFALKPSHRRTIAQAQHVVWLGKDMEPYLSKPLQRVAAEQTLDLSVLFDTVAVTDEPLTDALLNTSDSTAHDQDVHDEGAHDEDAQNNQHSDDHDEHNHSGQDPHIWLNPAAIKRTLALVQQQLNLAPPTAFLSQFTAWQTQAAQSLTARAQGFISFHDAFHYWIKHFQLTQTAILAIHPEQPIGTRHLLQVRALLEQGNVACLFVEPQFKASIVKRLQQGTDVPVVMIDPLASAFNVDDGQFLEFYQYLQQQFTTCLAPI